MNSTEAFTRATLYHSCLKSDILKHVDIDNADLDTLRDLVNKHSLLNSRKLPIIISKLLTKKCLEFVINKFPNLKNTLTPQNIRIDVEDDELAYLMNSTSNFKPNIVCLVTKNIVVSLLGSSIEAFKTHLLNNSESESSSSSSTTSSSSLSTTTPHVPKIIIKPTKINLKNHTMPTKFTDTFNTSRSNTTKELVNKVNDKRREDQKTARRNTLDSNRSNLNNIELDNEYDDVYTNDDNDDTEDDDDNNNNKDNNDNDTIEECTTIPITVNKLNQDFMHDKPIILENIELSQNNQQTLNIIANANHKQALEVITNTELQNEHSITIDTITTNLNVLQNNKTNNEINVNVSNSSPQTSTINIEDDIQELDNNPITLSDNEYETESRNIVTATTTTPAAKKSKIRTTNKKAVLSDLSAAIMKPKAVDFMELIASTSPDLLNEQIENDQSTIIIDDEGDGFEKHDENNNALTNGYADHSDDNESVNGEDPDKYIELDHRRSVSVTSSHITEDNFILDDDDDDF